jgi:hypothetical protein
MSADVGWLLVGLFTAHYLGDFTPLLSQRMLAAKREGRPIAPIALHGVIHGVLAAAAVGIAAAAPLGTLGLAAAIVLVSHFTIDLVRAQASARHPTLRDSGHRAFWAALGFDQLLHGLVLIAVAAVVL